MAARWLSMLLLVLLTGCSPHYQRTSVTAEWVEPSVDIAAATEDTCRRLIRDGAGVIGPDDKLVVASFADLDDLQSSSSLGRMMGQHCLGKIVREGYRVGELLMASSIFIAPGRGELVLSRKLDTIAAEHDVQHFVVGTYSVGLNTLYVSVKQVRTEDAVIVAARRFELPLTAEVRKLTRSDVSGARIDM